MIAVRSEKEIAILRQANQLVADVLATLAEKVKPGITTAELDVIAHDMIRKRRAAPAFLGYKRYPACSCISVEEAIVHGIPDGRSLKNGQIVSMDVGVYFKGFYGDAAITVGCGTIDELRQRLIRTTDRALARAITAARAGNYLVDVSRAIQETTEAEGFSVVRDFVGHGIGRKLHEEPQIPNFVTEKRGPRLRTGMVLAIEPMVNAGTHEVRILEDGWTAVTADGMPSAHFEHCVAVREHGGEILSWTPRLIWGQNQN